MVASPGLRLLAVEVPGGRAYMKVLAPVSP